MTDAERTTLAGEYVLGTLSLADRRRVERLRVDDGALDREILAWEARFGPLADTVAPVVPPPDLFARIEAELDRMAPADTPPPPRPARSAPWLAAAVALVVGGLGGYFADRLVRPETAGESFVAVVNRDQSEPALIVRVDIAAGTVTVRPVTAERPADRSLELWYIAPGATPASLGVIDTAAPTRALLGGRQVAAGGVFAVTVEQPGGSPTGAPEGPVVYSGRLIAE